MDHAAWLNETTEEPAQDKYMHFMRPEPKEDMGPIETDDDGHRWRMASVGMVRNASSKKPVKVWLDPLPHIQIEKAKPLQGWYKARDEKPGVRSRPCYTEAMLTEPYGGYCTVGCAFCYINSGFRGYRGTGLITVPLDYGDQIKAQIAKLKSSAAGYFSSFTDPFTPLEDRYHNTETGARAFTENGLPVFFLSRLAYPGWAYDLLQQNGHSYAQKSINTPDAEDWKKLSPGALPLDQHMAEIRALKRKGIYVSIQVNPIIAGITSHDEVEQLFEMLAEAGADHVIVKFVEAGYSWAPTMVERMIKRFGDNRAALFKELFVDNIGGQRTIDESYRMEGHERYSKKATALGLTYSVCYEYAYERDAGGNITSKTGVSIGPRFMTSGQCHGQRVPMYTRLSLGLPFEAVEDCPPSGCLTCASDNGGEARCGSELFSQAKALRPADLKQGVYD